MNWLYTILDAIPALWRLVEIKTEAMFLRQLKSYCLQLFRGELGEFEWIQDMTDTIADQLGKAWREGAKQVGVDPADFTDEDIEELNKIIASEYDYVLALGSDILALRLVGGSLEDYRNKFASRIEVWAHRYTDVVNQAVVWFGKRKKVKLKWEIGETEEHCATCVALNGLVAYAEDWERSGIHPQAPPNQALECGGWRCDCSLVVTTERATNNAFDEIVDRVTAAKAGEKSLKYDPNQPRVPAGNSDGGQWTDGGGGQLSREDITNQINEALIETAKELGIPPQMLDIKPGVNPVKPNIMGLCDNRDNSITIYCGAIDNPVLAREVLIHEYQHSVFNQLVKRATEEGSHIFIFNDGSFDKDIYKDYAILKTVDAADFSRTPAFSEYVDYVRKSGVNNRQVVEETLCEALRFSMTGRKDSVPKEVFDLLEIVTSAHSERGT